MHTHAALMEGDCMHTHVALMEGDCMHTHAALIEGDYMHPHAALMEGDVTLVETTAGRQMWGVAKKLGFSPLCLPAMGRGDKDDSESTAR